MAGAGATVVEHVPQGFPLFLMASTQAFQLRLRVRSHLGIALAGEELLGLGDLATQLEVTAVGDGDLGQRTPLLRQGGHPPGVRSDVGVEHETLDLQESLVVGLKLLEHGRAVRCEMSVGGALD